MSAAEPVAVLARLGVAGRRCRCCRCASQATATTFMPAITADAGFVPWAETGIRQTSRSCSPRVAMVRPDHHQPGILALRTGVRLERAGGEAGDLASHVSSVRKSAVIALGLIAGANGWRAPTSGQVTRHHLARGVQLHRAGAERDHRRRERQVARLQPLDVAEHLVLGVVAVEDRVGQEVRGPGVRRRDVRHGHAGRSQLPEREAALARRKSRAASSTSVAVVASSRAIAHRCVAERRRLIPRASAGAAARPPSGRRQLRPAACRRMARCPRRRYRTRGGARPPARTAARPWTRRAMVAQAVRTVIDGVHPGHDRQQHLRRADVAGRLLAPDVLLAGLERHAVGHLAVRGRGRRR